jgi:CO/xanthine dehydrogenase Mo-binding subunit
MASHAAVARAVAHATGRRLAKYPLDPPRVRALLREME